MHHLTTTKALLLPPTKNFTMKSLHCFLSILSALLLLHHCLSITLPPSLNGVIIRDKLRPRRMLQAIETNTIDTKGLRASANTKPQIEVDASLRRAPKSTSNPKGN